MKEKIQAHFIKLYLGLVLTVQEYGNRAQGTPYVKPSLPTLNTTTNDTQFILAQKRHQYEMEMLTYRERLIEF